MLKKIKQIFRNEQFKNYLHIFGLCSLAIAQPLFDILGKNATFFVAHKSTSADILLLVLFLCFVIPAVLILVTMIFRRLNEKAGIAVHAVQLAILMSVLLLPFAKKLTSVSGMMIFIIVGVLGIAYAIFYLKNKHIRSFTNILSFAVIIVPVLFLFFSPVNKFVLPSIPPIPILNFKSSIPVVLVVFDEFSLVSLMDENHNIDSLRYPNIAALSKNAYWFRNATAVSDGTDLAVPAILTGQMPVDSIPMLPSYIDYPNNIFTLLNGKYDFHVLESVTNLCPSEYLNDHMQTPSFSYRAMETSTDLGVIFLQLLLPADYSNSLPSVTQNWGGFGEYSENVATSSDSLRQMLVSDRQKKGYTYFRDRVIRYRNIVNDIKRSQEPSLIVMHNLLPHVPWEYLPSGKKYLRDLNEKIPGLSQSNEKWGNDTNIVLQNYQRYLLQVAFVDKLIGELVIKLKSEQMYDDALIVITADHGVSFIPNDYRRPFTDKNYPEILSVPLLIKTPHQHDNVISDRSVETVDILPTIAKVLSIDLPWKVDGISLFDSASNERSNKTAFHTVTRKYVTYPSSIDGKYVALKRKLELFGSGQTPYKLYNFGPYEELIGKRVIDFPISFNVKFNVSINNQRFYQFLNTDLDYLYARLIGNITIDGNYLRDPTFLAVVVNDTIRAITRVTKSSENKFSAMVPETSFQPGRNIVDIYIVDEHLQRVRLMHASGAVHYTLNKDANEVEYVKTSEGNNLQFVHQGCSGVLDSLVFFNNQLHIEGWSVDFQNGKVPDAIIVFINGRFYDAGIVGGNRSDIALKYNNKALSNSSFYFSSPYEKKELTSDPEVRVFSVYKNGVYELFVPSKEKSSYSKGQYSLVKNKITNDLTLKPIKGKALPVVQNLIAGNIDLMEIVQSNLNIVGWTADLKKFKIADSVLIFAKDKNIFTISTGVNRPDLVSLMGKNSLLNAGFNVTIPLNAIHNLKDVSSIRLFAYSKKIGVATEITRPVIAKETKSKIVDIKYAYIENEHGELKYLKDLDGNRIQILQNVYNGSVDKVVFDKKEFEISGWAVNVERYLPAKYIVIFEDKKYISTISVGLNRPDVLKYFKKEGLKFSGFSYKFPSSISGKIKDTSKLKYYAIGKDDDVGSEIFPPNKIVAKEPIAQPKSQPSPSAYTLFFDKRANQSFLVAPEKKGISVLPLHHTGNTDIIKIERDTLFIAGWAVDNKRVVPSRTIIVFVGDKNVASLPTGVERPDIDTAYGNRAVRFCGFSGGIPISQLGKLDSTTVIRIFAIAKDLSVATELPYPPNYPFKH